MNRERYEYLCNQCKEGHEDVFVNHPSSSLGGEVIQCGNEGFKVRTSDGGEHQWDYRECEETLSRREIYPYR